jgi:carbonic anhydrase
VRVAAPAAPHPLVPALPAGQSKEALVTSNSSVLKNLRYDLPAALVVFLVALPLCLGIAMASGVPLFSGIIAGIVGGIVIGALSGSHTSVSGPAAGLSAVVLAAVLTLQNFEIFLLAVVIAGVFQIILGLVRVGALADFMPSNVIKGLLAAIGIILVLKQIPHAFGYDADAIGDFSFFQLNRENTFSALSSAFSNHQIGSTIVCFVSIGLLLLWEKTPLKKINLLPAPLVVVVVAILINQLFLTSFPALTIAQIHLVTIPVGDSVEGFFALFKSPDFTAITNPAVWKVGFTLALVASLETLLNLEATDKLDPHKRKSSPNRELLAQGVGNTLSGLIGGMPLTSVIVRSSANINAGAVSRTSAILHGVLLLVCAFAIPNVLNMIPLAALAAILILTGYKLAKVSIFKEMYARGWKQFVPFIVTVVAIVFTDLLLGIGIGLAISLLFILMSNFRNPFNFVKNDYHTGEIIRLELAPQVSFFNKPSIHNTLYRLPPNSQVVIDASDSDFIDYDVLETIEEFRTVVAVERNIALSLVGFKEEYKMADHIKYVQVLTEEMQQRLTPAEVLKFLKLGNQRFQKGDVTFKDLNHQVKLTANAQHPMAAILGCIDSRVSNELIFDIGLGDVFSARVAGNVVSDDVLGSLEYACNNAGAKLIVVLGHSNCGAVKAACDYFESGHITQLLAKIQTSVESEQTILENRNSKNAEFVAKVTEINVAFSVERILQRSSILADLWRKEEIDIVGAVYDVNTGAVNFIDKGTIFRRLTEEALFSSVRAGSN